ncbi:caspase domain-containing protein [Embleya sp. NBC_00896]|uniref:caspase family protein n=1 Tax=Embleya sp. NBC_00896 TaxID=2975961 RepID=UPI003868F6DA|nr:caspase family protein [Embleya sp. NBC_00896]
MGHVYSFLVGIDTYPVTPLKGCVNDVDAVERRLDRMGLRAPAVRVLRNREATHAAVLAGLRTHLGQAGAGDTALFWFSGHGIDGRTDDPTEGTGRGQALVCADSLDPGGFCLPDKELGALLDDIARKGVHVVAVLDCCYSGGATRRGATVRGLSGTWTGGPAGGRGRGNGHGRESGYGPGSWRGPGSGNGSESADGVARFALDRGAGTPGPELPRHVAIAAARVDQPAHEGVIKDVVRGYLSHTLLRVLDEAGPGSSIRELHALTDAGVRRLRPDQNPTLVGSGDLPLLGGSARVPAVRGTSSFLLRRVGGEWEIDCGSAHGLRGVGGEFVVRADQRASGVAAPDAPTDTLDVVEVVEVRPEACHVRPLDWRPDPARVYPVTPSALALPGPTVTVSGERYGAGLVQDALAVSGFEAPTGSGGLDLRVVAHRRVAEILGAGGGRLVEPLPLTSPADAERVVACLAHVARWHRIRDLANPDPSLSALVEIEIEPLVGGLTLGPGGEFVCSYLPDGGSPPQVRVRLHNHSDRKLWFVLLDLTDSYASQPTLYPGDFVGPGRAGLAREGKPVWLYLPKGRAVRPGASVRDWLRLVVAENELNIEPFLVPAWDPHTAAARGAGGGVDPEGVAGVLRLTVPESVSGPRDMGAAPRPVARWGTTMVEVRTVVP